jgi:aryl-alcohol dehydrogenase-like predicted oxidoreductase
VDELMRALDDQVRAGRVLYVGISDTPAWMVAYANALADARGWTPFCALQGQYSLLERTVEREYVPMAQALDLALLAWAPLAAGLLTGKYRKETESTPVSGRLNVLGSGAEQLANERTARIVEAVGEVAAAVGCTPAQVALAWLGSRSGVVIPIIGARSEGQLRENLGALEVELDGEQLARLERASAVELGFPHDFMAEVEGQPWAYGDLWPMLADHRLGHTARRLPAPGPG